MPPRLHNKRITYFFFIHVNTSHAGTTQLVIFFSFFCGHYPVTGEELSGKNIPTILGEVFAGGKVIVPDSLDPNQGAAVMNLSWLLGPQGDGGGRGRAPRRSAAKNPNQVRLVLSIHTATQGKIPKSKKNRGRSKHAFPIYLFF